MLQRIPVLELNFVRIMYTEVDDCLPPPPLTLSTQTEICGGYFSFELYKLAPPAAEECPTPVEAYAKVHNMLVDLAAPFNVCMYCCQIICYYHTT